jgi:hypothetical protein
MIVRSWNLVKGFLDERHIFAWAGKLSGKGKGITTLSLRESLRFLRMMGRLTKGNNRRKI